MSIFEIIPNLKETDLYRINTMHIEFWDEIQWFWDEICKSVLGDTIQ